MWNFPLADDVVSNNDLLLVRLGDDSGPVHGDADDGQGAHEGSHRGNGSHKSKKRKECCYSTFFEKRFLSRTFLKGELFLFR